MAPNPTAAAAAEPGDLLTAPELFEVLRQAIPSDAVLVEESPSNLGELHTAWPIERPDSYSSASGTRHQLRRVDCSVRRRGR